MIVANVRPLSCAQGSSRSPARTRRPVVGDDLRDVEEQRALRVAQEAVWPAERILLGDAGDRERLARKPGQAIRRVRVFSGIG